MSIYMIIVWPVILLMFTIFVYSIIYILFDISAQIYKDLSLVGFTEIETINWGEGRASILCSPPRWAIHHKILGLPSRQINVQLKWGGNLPTVWPPFPEIFVMFWGNALIAIDS